MSVSVSVCLVLFLLISLVSDVVAFIEKRQESQMAM